mgnify:CR=1 FL=1
MPPPPPQFPPWRPTSTVSAEEARKFAALANEWWDPKGPFAPLHDMNPVRCRFLRSALCSAFGRDVRAPAPLAGLRLLDVGCGGGLLAESLARMGAHVTGIDVNEGGIATAEAHAALDADLAGRLTYRTAAAEQLVAEGASFDAGATRHAEQTGREGRALKAVQAWGWLPCLPLSLALPALWQPSCLHPCRHPPCNHPPCMQ